MKIMGVLCGIVLSSIGLMFIFLYTNLFTMGYSFLEFVKFISKRFECWFLLLGILIILKSSERGLKNVLLLRRSFKLWK